MLSPRQVQSLFPLSIQDREWLVYSRFSAQAIVEAKDPRKAVIVGPCSIHDKTSALEYAEHLRKLAYHVDKACFVVMRVYLEKSRTTIGWKGLVYDPYLDGSHAMETGLIWGRELLTELVKMRVPVATEFVDPLVSAYFEDLITWGFIGARTTTSQPHRQFASHLSIPMGFKNTLQGDIEEAIEGVIAASSPHAFLHTDLDGLLTQKLSQGNPHCHIVLRGSRSEVNYDPSSIQKALHQLEKHKLPLRLMVDCAHGNSQKEHTRQKEAFSNVLVQMREGGSHILGLMLESHLKEGNQPLQEDPSSLEYAVSITDPCINWNTTEELLYQAADTLSLR